MPSTARALLLACHPGPTLAVTTLTALLAAGAGTGPATGALVTAAVLAGQLSIGWSNDLIDTARDRATGRTDKPMARGELAASTLAWCTRAALALCVALSVACGWRSAGVHLVLGVAAGWAYNLELKSTPVSPLPYAVAFGALPAVVTLAGPDPRWPAWWVMVTAALLGVAAHLFNALPDLEDDRATGVIGLPHRLGDRRTRVLGVVVLLIASGLAAFGPGEGLGLRAGVSLALAAGLAASVLLTRGKWPFVAVVAIALLCLSSVIDAV